MNWRRLFQRRKKDHWTDAQIDQINAEMAEGIIHEIGEVLAHLGCCHGPGVRSTPPMFYPEMVVCAVRHAKGVHTDGCQARWENITK